MKISPLAQGTGVPAAEFGAVSTQRTSPDRIAAAKAIAAGESSIRVSDSDRNQRDPQVERLEQQNVRKIKMRTQYSPDRQTQEIEDQPLEQSAISDPIEQTQPAFEETKPLSPQFAALAKQRRALQQERAVLEQEKATLLESSKDAGSNVMAQLKSDPLSVLSKAGVTYDQLTEAILNGQSNPEIAELKAKIEALEKGVDTKFTDRDTQQEQQTLREIQREADYLVQNGGDAYEMIRVEGKSKEVTNLIHRTWKQTGEVLDVSEALELVENELIKETLKRAEIGKIRSRMTPAQEIQQQQPQEKTMRTLTNRDGARPILDRRSRAIAAAQGRLTR